MIAFSRHRMSKKVSSILIIALFIVSMFASIGQAWTLGETGVGDVDDVLENSISGSRITATNATRVNSISVRLEVTTASHKVKCAIYNDDGANNASTLIATTEEKVLSAAAWSWYTFNFSSPPILAAGNYWIVGWANATSGACDIKANTTVSNPTIYKTVTYASPFPSPLTGETYFDGWNFCIYATCSVPDTTPPISSVNAISPYLNGVSKTITATASDAGDGVKNVSLYYAYSADNATFGAYSNFGIDSSLPWSWIFTFPNSAGYYRFYSIATDNASNVESAPGSPDTRCRFYVDTPSVVSGMSPYNVSHGLTYWKAISAYTVTISDVDWGLYGFNANGYLKYTDVTGWHTTTVTNMFSGPGGSHPRTITVPHATVGTNFLADTTYPWSINISQNGHWTNKSFFVRTVTDSYTTWCYDFDGPSWDGWAHELQVYLTPWGGDAFIYAGGSTQTHFTSPTFDATGYTALTVDYDIGWHDSDSHDYYTVEFYDGATWQNILTQYWISNHWTTKSISVSCLSYNFPVNAQFRFTNHGHQTTCQVEWNNICFTGTNIPTVIVSTNASTSVGPVSATLHGFLNSDGGFSSLNYGFQWNTADDFAAPLGTWTGGLATQGSSFSHGISGLTNGVTYYFRAFVVNSSVYTYGDSMSFTTHLTLVTNTTTNINTSYARLHAWVGPGLNGAYGFLWDSDTGTPYAHNTTVGTSAVGNKSFLLNLSLSSTYKYFFRAWAHGSFYMSDEDVFWTLPDPVSNLSMTTSTSLTLTLEWDYPPSNDPDNLSCVLRYGLVSYPANETDGTSLGMSTSDTWTGTPPFSPTGRVYVAAFALFAGNYSVGTNLTVNVTGGTYNFELRHADASKQYGLVDLDESAVGKHTFIINYKDPFTGVRTQEYNYYVPGYWNLPSFHNFTEWFPNGFLPELETALRNVKITTEGSYITKATWDRRDEMWGIIPQSLLDIKVDFHILTAGTYTVGVFGFLPVVTQAFATGDHSVTFAGTLGTLGWSGPYWSTYVYQGFGVTLVGPGSVDIIKNVPASPWNPLVEHGSQSWTGANQVDWPAYDASFGLLWADFIADTGATCSNFESTWWPSWRDNITTALSTIDSLPLISVVFPTWPTIPDISCAALWTPSNWTDCESDLHDPVASDGKWYVNTTKIITSVTFIWSDATDLYNISWNSTNYCLDKQVAVGSPIVFYIRTDLHYIPFVTDTFHGQGLVQYHIYFSGVSATGAYANVYLWDKFNNKRVIFSDFLDGNSKIHPMLICNQDYYLELHKADGSLVDCGSFTATNQEDITVSGQGQIINNLIYQYCDISATWTATGFQVMVTDNNIAIAQMWFTVYYPNGTVAYNATSTGLSHTFIFIGATDVSWYYKVEVSDTLVGFMSTGKVPMMYSPAIPTVSGSYINNIFTLLFGPSPLSMGGTHVDWAYILVLILALIGLLAFVRGKYLGLIVEGFIFICSAAVMNDILASAGLGIAGAFLIIVGLFFALTGEGEEEKERA